MGTAITLSLNGIDIDWGKNRYWRSHHWLFPPESLTDIEYAYADEVLETKPGFETPLSEAYFRLCHLGYSSQETKTKFDTAIARWNRTAALDLSFEQFRGALSSVDFRALTRSDMEPYIWDFRGYVIDLLAAWDTDGSHLEDFIHQLDFAITLRVLADRSDSRSLPLRWHHQDLVDSGWVTLEDLTDIDRPTFLLNHTLLFGRLQDQAGISEINKFDNWLADRGLPQATPYLKLRRDGAVIRQMLTLPTAVRHMSHHPENLNNRLTDERLRESLELLLEIAKRVPRPLDGLA